MSEVLEKVTGVPIFLFGYHKYKIYSEDAFYLHKDIVANYKKAVELALNAGYHIVAVDGYRPMGIQRVLNKGEPNEFVLDETISMHCKGLAVDVSMKGKIDNPVPGSQPYTDIKFQTRVGTFTKDSYSDNMDITDEELENRTKLQGFMLEAGFKTIQSEWWHFEIDIPDAKSLDDRPKGIPNVEDDSKMVDILSSI